MTIPDAEAVPVTIGATSPRRHITGTTAMNIPNPRLWSSGDWHKQATWFGPAPDSLDDVHYTDEETYGAVLDRLGRSGLRDARAGLRRLGHPGGDSATKIWAATHDRAVIEMAWAGLMQDRRYGEDRAVPPVDSLELARWLAYPHQWIRLHWWAWRLRWSLQHEERRKWDRWRKEWTPWPTG